MEKSECCLCHSREAGLIRDPKRDDQYICAKCLFGERDAVQEKMAPVQDYSAGIPWAMHLRAYDAYCKRFAPQPAMIDLQFRNCRGGFAVRELDEFIPGWREELEELPRLRATVKKLEAELSEARVAVDQLDQQNKRADWLEEQRMKMAKALTKIRDQAQTTLTEDRLSEDDS